MCVSLICFRQTLSLLIPVHFSCQADHSSHLESLKSPALCLSHSLWPSHLRCLRRHISFSFILISAPFSERSCGAAETVEAVTSSVKGEMLVASRLFSPRTIKSTQLQIFKTEKQFSCFTSQSNKGELEKPSLHPCML